MVAFSADRRMHHDSSCSRTAAHPRFASWGALPTGLCGEWAASRDPDLSLCAPPPLNPRHAQLLLLLPQAAWGSLLPTPDRGL